MKRNYLSDDSIMAMYLALCAARKGTSVVYLTNDDLRWRLGKPEGRRLSKLQLKKFAARLKPIFPRNYAKPGKNGPLVLFLYLNKKNDSSAKPERVVIGNKAEMHEALGIQAEAAGS